MDFETLRIEKDIDKYLEVKMDYKGGIDWISDAQTNTFLNECYETLYEEEKNELIDFVESSITMLKFDVLNSKESIESWKEKDSDKREWMIDQHQLANIERKKKRKFLKKWLKELSVKSSNIKPKLEELNKFSVALNFANGNIDRLKIQDLNNTQIAKKLYENQFKGYRPYISASINRTKSGGNKNIFLDPKIIKAVVKHCKEENIEIIPNFNCHNLEL